MTESAIFIAPHWFFMGLGGVLLITELWGTSGYGLWSGISSVVVGIIAAIIPLSWSTLWILFAILTLITAYVWWMWMKKHGHDKSKKGALNQPQSSLIGIDTKVVSPIINGSGRVKINDGTWTAKSDEDIGIGTMVTVVEVDGLVLKVVKKS